MTAPPRLSVEGITVRYARTEAVRSVSLAAQPGELLALTGPNGSGKTTLLRAALGLLPAAEGKVRVEGVDVTSLPPRERARRLAWVPQEESPRDNVTVEEYVTFGRYAHLPPFAAENRHDRELVRESLRSVDLWEKRRSGILEISGGERQRALLARALAQEAPVLLMDEPTAHLDIGHQLDLFHKVRRLLVEKGTCVVAAMHDLNLAARFADRIAVLFRGGLVTVGPPARVLSPDILRRVWGVEAVRRSDPRTGRPYLLPHIPEHSGTGELAEGLGPVHVVGGGGAASPLLRRLTAEGFRLTTGILHLLDTDSETATELGVPVAAEVPFSPIGEEARRQLRKLLEEARAVVVAPFWTGPSNLANLEELVPFAGRKPLWIVGIGSAGARDSSGGEALRLLHDLVAKGAEAVDDEGMLLERLRLRLRDSATAVPTVP